MLEIIINESVVELSEVTKIGLTLQSNTIGSLSNRQGNFTNKFKLPKTKHNQIILENSDNINSNTNIPYQKLSAKVVQNGIEIVADGIAIIENADSFYNVNITSGNTSFFDLINSKNVHDLDLSAFDHVWNHSNVVASRNNTSGYIYPIIETFFDWNLYSSLYTGERTAISYRLIACVFMKTIWERIILESGYSQSGSFIESQIYDRLILPPNYWGRTDEWIDEQSGDQKLVTENNIQYTTNGISFTTRVDNFTGMGTETHFSNGGIATFTAPDSMYGELIISAQLRIGLLGFATYKIDDFYLDIVDVNTGQQICASSDIIDDITGAEWIAISSGVAVKVMNKELRSGRIYLIGGHVYQARLILKESANMGLSVFRYSTLTGTTFSFQAEPEITFGSTVEIEKLVKNYKQTEFMKQFMNMYCVIPQVNEYTRTINFNFFDDLLANIPIAIDWSNLIDESMGCSVYYRDDNYAQINKFQYTVDESNSFDETFTDGEILIDDLNLDAEKTLVKLDFAGTETILRMVDENVPHIRCMKSNYSVEEVKQRVLLLDSQNGVDPISYTDGTTTTSVSDNIPMCYFVKSGKNDNLSFNDSLLNNYSAIAGIMTKYKKIVLYLNAGFGETQIANFDFSIPVFIDKHTEKIHVNGHFYVNRIENFQKGKSTKVELIRL